MLQNLPSAVYKCILPIEKSLDSSSAVYQSLLNDQPREAAQAPPFPAWPAIDDPNQPCCLPTLRPAMYFVHRSADVKSDKTTIRAEKHLSRQGGIDFQIKEQALAFLKAQAQQTYFRHLSEITASPQILFSYGDTTGFLRKCGPLIAKEVLEASIQASIYGNHKNFFGDEEAYGFAHEYGHLMARLFYHALILDGLSETAQATLSVIGSSTTSPEHISALWALFQTNNTGIRLLAQTFEPIEEIYATYVGLRFSPIEVRNKVEKRVKNELRKRNWHKGYEAFVETCDECQVHPVVAGLYLFEPLCRMLELFAINGIDINPADFLCTFIEIIRIIRSYQKIDSDPDDTELEAIAENEAAEEINRILEQAHVPQEVYWSVVPTMRKIAYPRLMRLMSFIQDQKLKSCARITMMGRPSEKTIDLFVTYNKEAYENSMHLFVSPFERIFFESLRQQLTQECDDRVVTIVCPFARAYKGKCGCGFKEQLLTLYQRLPDEYRKRFKLPKCVALAR